MKNIEEMSDDEIMNIDDSVFEESINKNNDNEENIPEDQEISESTQPSEPEESEEQEVETTESNPTDEDEKPIENTKNTDNSENNSENPIEEEENSSNINSDNTSTNTTNETSTDQPSEDKIDYEAFYNKVVKTPIKANGKTIELRNSKEAIQLMQMGANYTKKMQAIAPYKKTLMMLENNGLLNEDKLNFLIDIDKKNPEAIKKLLADAQIDPYEMDMSEESTYTPKDYRVSNEEAMFTSTLEDLQQTPEGKETIDAINSWDQESKGILWTQPDVMRVINDQRANGVYDKISTEIERQKLLGNIPSNTPFLQAYKTVGDMMMAQQQAHKPVAVRAVKPKTNISNKSRAHAASTVRSSNNVSKKYINPLAMSDEEFLKQMEGRL